MRLDEEQAAPSVEYAFWQPDGEPFRVQYSLAAFHEIDFQVNEGYRRIPHGGVEIGGVLWGHRSADLVVVEAFRQIECEHASGPSFSLSERDLAGISDLLGRAANEDELRTLHPVGWFVAHTRSPLTLTDRELAIFDRFFSGAGMITLLVKPERFQPTRFGFLLRQGDGNIPRDAAPQAFILPLPGRAGKGVVASIPAPAEKKAVVLTPVATVVQPPAEKAPEIPPMPVAPLPTPEPVPAPAAKAPALTPSTPAPPPPATPIRERREERFRGMPAEKPQPAPPTVAARSSSSSTFRLFLLLLLAAGLGCAVGYIAYLQLPSPRIELQVQKRSANLLVQWPAEQTKGVEYAAVRVDDGPPQLLTPGQKESGVLEVPARTSITKVEIIAQHWIRDSRGTVKFVSDSAQ